MPRLRVWSRTLWLPLSSNSTRSGKVDWTGAMPAGSVTEQCSIPSPNPESPAEVQGPQPDWETTAGGTNPRAALTCSASQPALKVSWTVQFFDSNIKWHNTFSSECVHNSKTLFVLHPRPLLLPDPAQEAELWWGCQRMHERWSWDRKGGPYICCLEAAGIRPLWRWMAGRR